MREEGRSSHGDVHIMSGQGKQKVSRREEYIDPYIAADVITIENKPANAIKYSTCGSVAWFQLLQHVSACIMVHQDGSTSISIRTHTELTMQSQWVCRS